MARKKVADDEALPEVAPRPLGMGDFLGHARQRALLERALKRGALNPSLLLTGPSGVGKATLALRLAAALQCDAPTPWACGVCPPCRKVARGLHPDLREITQAVNAETGKAKRDIVVDQVREAVVAPLALPPYEGRRLIFLIDPADALNANAQNALLKSLEEPPSYVQFLLVTAAPAALLPTVRSRCQVVSFGPLGEADMRRACSVAGLSGEKAQQAAEAAAGAPGPLLSGEWKAAAKRRESLAALLEGGLHAARYPDLAPRLEALAGEPPRLVLQDALRLVADTRRAGLRGQGLLLDAARARGPRGLSAVADRLAESVSHLERNVNPRLLLERAFLAP